MRRPPFDDAVIRSVCPHDCPDACSILSHVKGGRLLKIEGNPAHPVTRGYICQKFAKAPKRVYGEDRLLYPMQRVGRKGGDNFKRITWDEAINIIVTRWKEIISRYGPMSILPFFGSGTEGLVHGHIAGRRFFNKLGTLQLIRTICTKPGRTGYRYTMGTSMGADPTAIANTKLVIAWGVNFPSTNIHQISYIREAQKNGALYAVINPLKIRGAETADSILQPRPGSDAALALGMMYVIIKEGLYDHDFISQFTFGFNELKERVKDFLPEKVAELTDIAAKDIITFSRLYADRKPSFIYIGPGCQRHSNGGMTVRTIACLPALVGAWRKPGGGVYFPTSTIFPVDWHPLEGEELRPNPPAGYNMIDLAKMLNGSNPHIHSLYVFNGNPATVLYNQKILRCGLEKEGLFTVVHEQYLTDTARYADIVLPATTQFEHADLHFSYYHFNLSLNQPAIHPLGECRSNLETFNLLAAGMGFEDPCFKKNDWDVIDEILELNHPALAGITLDRLMADGWAPVKVESIYTLIKNNKLPTPSNRIEFYSEKMEDSGLEPLPTYSFLKESKETTPDLFKKYPLFFLTPSGHSIHNSNFAQEVGILETEKRPILIINPADASLRGIKSGELVRVFNDRGACLLWANVEDLVRPGVVASPGQWWDRHYLNGCNANHTTPDFHADMGGGSAFNTNLVEVERIDFPAEACLVHRGLGRVEFFDFTREGLADIKFILSGLEREGRKHFSFHSPIVRSEYFPYSGVTCFFLCDESSKRELSFSILRHTLEEAKQWGAEYVVSHLAFGPTDTKSEKTAITLAQSACRRIAEMSRSVGIPVDIEFSAYSNSFNRADLFVETVGVYSELGICIDIGHTYLGALKRGRDYLHDVIELAPKARSMHLWNTSGMQHNGLSGHIPLHPSQRPEQGWINIERVLEIVLDKNPGVNIIFEYPVETVSLEIQEGYDWIAKIVARFRQKSRG